MPDTAPAGYVSVWRDDFRSLSLRTGGPTPAGYAAGKGTWTAAGLWSRTGLVGNDTDKGSSDFGYGQFIDHAYNWQALDPAFPPLGMVDITSEGLILKATASYPLVRAAFPDEVPGSKPLLSSLLASLYAAKIKIPFMRRTRVWMPGGLNDFPAAWGLSEKSFADQYAKGYETDDDEVFGTVYPTNRAASTTHVSTTVGPSYNTVSQSTFLLAGYSLVGRWFDLDMLMTSAGVQVFVDGMTGGLLPHPSGAELSTYHHSILNMSTYNNGTFPAAYPDAQMKVASVEYFAPPSNTDYVFPPTHPVPAISWQPGFSATSIPVGTASGTTIGTVSGASTYAVIGGGGKIVLVGTALKTSGALSAGTLRFAVEGYDANGWPGISPGSNVVATVS